MHVLRRVIVLILAVGGAIAACQQVPCQAAEKEVATFQGLAVLEGAIFQIDGEKEHRLEVMVQLPEPKLFYPETLIGVVKKIADDGEEQPCVQFNILIPLGQKIAQGAMVLDDCPTGRYCIEVAASGRIIARVIDTGLPAGTTREKLFRRSRLVGKWEQNEASNQYVKAVLEINRDGTATETLWHKPDDDGYELRYSLTPTSATTAMVYGLSKEGLRYPFGQIGLQKNQLVAETHDITDKSSRPVRKTYKRVVQRR